MVLSGAHAGNARNDGTGATSLPGVVPQAVGVQSCLMTRPAFKFLDINYASPKHNPYLSFDTSTITFHL